MQTDASSSTLLYKQTKKSPSPSVPSPSTPQSRRKGTAKIDDPRKCAETFFKRSVGIIKKANALNSLTDAQVAFFMLSPKGELHYFSEPSVDKLISEFLCRMGDVTLPMSSKEGVDRDCASSIMKHLGDVVHLLKKLEGFKNNPSLNAGAGVDSGVGAGRDPSPLAFTLRNTNTMHTESSSSLSISNKTKKRPSSPTPSPSPPNMVCPRRKGTDKIDDPKNREGTFSKRSNGLVKKASALNSLTNAPVAFFMLPHKGKLNKSISDFLCRRVDVTLPMSPKEGVDWAEKECDSCATKEDCASLIMKHLEAVVRLIKKSEGFENNPPVNAGAGDDSGVGAGHDLHVWLSMRTVLMATFSQSRRPTGPPPAVKVREWILTPRSKMPGVIGGFSTLALNSSMTPILGLCCRRFNREGNENNSDGSIFGGVPKMCVRW